MFKVGDKVVCVKDSDTLHAFRSSLYLGLTNGKTYIVNDAFHDNDGDAFVWIRDDYNVSKCFYAERFVLENTNDK